MKYLSAARQRKLALAECRAARADLDDATGRVIEVYQARPLPVLASVAGAGFVLARLRVGDRFVRTGMRIASGPGWRLVRQYLTL